VYVCMCVCVYVCMYVCVYVCVCMYVCVCVERERKATYKFADGCDASTVRASTYRCGVCVCVCYTTGPIKAPTHLVVQWWK